MNPRRYYLTVLLLCACGTVNVLFYVLSNGDAAQRNTSLVGLRPIEDHQLVSKHSLSPGVTETDDADFHRVNGAHSFIRKLNNAESTDTAKKLEDTKRVDGDDYTRLYEFVINNVELCGDAEDKTNSIVIVVTSRMGNFLRRNAIRNTWGSVVKELDGILLFLIGVDSNEKHQHQVEKESELYADIVQVNIFDAYENLTYRSIAMLQWLTDYCTNSKFYLKADDDTYVNVENVLNETKTINRKEVFLCHVFNKAPPIRDPNSKWYVSRDHYAGKYFPKYCSGSVYVFSSSIINRLYISALKAKMCVMEDVFITGIAAEGKGIAHIHNGAFAFYKRNATGCEYAHALSGHEVTITQMYIIFAQLTNHEVDCETNTNLILKKAEDEMAKFAHRK